MPRQGKLGVRELTPRPWASKRIADWLEEADGAAMMLVRGDPGSGKSSLLLQVAAAASERDLLAHTSRAADRPDPFDGFALLAAIIDHLTHLGIDPYEVAQLPPSFGVSVDMQVDEVQTGGKAIGAVVMSSEGRLLPIAEAMIRAVEPERRLLIVVDAIDQAEDEGAEPFLNSVAALARAARGTGVRLLSSSRRGLPAAFDEDGATSFNLISDAPPDVDDLRKYLELRFANLEEADRDRAVGAILSGADDNWLWATTNADSLSAKIAESGNLPASIQLTAGLDGLYRDGIQRIKRKMQSTWDPFGRQLLTAISCSLEEHLTLTELRWITGKEPAEIEGATRMCEPFLQRSDQGVRLFHPDFGRWILADNVEGISEQAGHLAVAQGFSAFGRDTNWNTAAANAAARVVDHWCDVLVLDPFSPHFDDYERELEEVLTNPRWVQQATIGLDAIEQAAQVAPSLRFPGTTMPLITGLRALHDSSAAERLVEGEFLTNLSAGQLETLDSILAKETAAAASRWLEEEVRDYETVIARALWGGVLERRVTITRTGGQLRACLSAETILAALPSLDPAKLVRLSDCLKDIDGEQFPDLTAGIEAALPDAGDTSSHRAFCFSLLGRVYSQWSTQRNDDPEASTEHLNLAVDAYREALANVGEGDERQEFVIQIADALRRLSVRSDDELDELIVLQRELVEMRRAANGDWPFSARLLGDAYRESAQRRKGEPTGHKDHQRAIEAYREALAGVSKDAEARLEYLIKLANALLDLEEPSDQELNDLISVQGELVDLRRANGDPLWPEAANLLGEAYVAVAKKLDRGEEGKGEEVEGESEHRAKETSLALAAYREVLAATPTGSDRRLTFSFNFANALLGLKDRTDSELDELIAVQTELVALRGAADEPGWAASAKILGDVHAVRAATIENDTTRRDADLRQALTAYRDSLGATPADDDTRPGLVDAAAAALGLLERRSDNELEELIELQTEQIEARKSAEQDWAVVSNLLGDSYRERSRRREPDDDRRGKDLSLALESYRQAVAVTAADHEKRDVYVIDLVNTLRELDSRTDSELDEMVEAQAEMVLLRKQAGDGDWALSSDLLGLAYSERAKRRAEDDEDGAAADLHLALEAYRTALEAAPAGHELRVEFLIDVANALNSLPERSDDELDEMIGVQEELMSWYLEAGNPGWPQAANLIGDAYRERARRQSDATLAEADLRRALIGYREALAGTTAESENRIVFARDFANALIALDKRTDGQLEELIAVQGEVVKLSREAGQDTWPVAANLLGDAYRERAERRESDQTAWDQDLRLALAAYREALAATPTDSKDRLVFVIDVANTLRNRKSRRSASEVDELVEVQRELLSLRKKDEDPNWPHSANLLGDAYSERAMQRDEDADRADDLDLALVAYREALEAVPEDSENRLTFAIDTANTMVIRAAVTKRGGPETLEEATRIVAGAAEDSPSRPEFARLLSVLRAAFRKHDRWQA